jgi:drug/metabolite transporter (DMT)-like permease
MSDIAALLHAGLLVSDLARAKAFYESVLGLALYPDRPELPYPGEWYDLGGVTEGDKSVSIWVGVAVLTVIGLWRYPGELNFIEAAEWNVWLLLLAVGLLIGSMTYAVQYGLARVPANQAIVIFLFELVVAAVAAYYLSMERMGLQEWGGAVMIITASLFSGHMEDDQMKEKRHV